MNPKRLKASIFTTIIMIAITSSVLLMCINSLVKSTESITKFESFLLALLVSAINSLLTPIVYSYILSRENRLIHSRFIHSISHNIKFRRNRTIPIDSLKEYFIYLKIDFPTLINDYFYSLISDIQCNINYLSDLASSSKDSRIKYNDLLLSSNEIKSFIASLDALETIIRASK